MASVTITRTLQAANQTIGGVAQGVTDGMNISIIEPVAASATIQLMTSIDVSAVKAFAISSDQNLTIKTNSSGSPDDTLALLANKPYIWQAGDYDAFKFTVDIVSMFVVNGTADPATIRVEALVDATPV